MQANFLKEAWKKRRGYLRFWGWEVEASSETMNRLRVEGSTPGSGSQSKSPTVIEAPATHIGDGDIVEDVPFEEIKDLDKV